MLNYNNKTVFKKITDVINGRLVNKIVKKYDSDYRIQHFDTQSHVNSMIYNQISQTNSMRGLIDKLQYSPKLKQMINVPSTSQLCRKNSTRDYRIFEDIYYEVMGLATKKLGFKKANEHFKSIKAIDSTIVQVAASLAPNLYNHNKKAGMKMSTMLNVSNFIPEKVEIVPGKINDRKCITDFIKDKNTVYVFDRGYVDYKWYDYLTEQGFKFITRQIENVAVQEEKSFYTGNDQVFDYEVFLGTYYNKNMTKYTYREILTFDKDDNEVRILTNIFDIPVEAILETYRLRWQIEVFFKWIKQNLKIKRWIGYNENAVKIQLYSALITYILLILLRLELKSKLSMCSFTKIITMYLLEFDEILTMLSG
jgi:hypothetical protein